MDWSKIEGWCYACFLQELEQIEEDWRKESSHLLTVIAKLQDENKRLNFIIANKTNFEQGKLF